ncbi:hypothetical protein GCM10028895_07420 [Pontibacter rugosus]
MTTDKDHMDTTGAEQNKPLNQEASEQNDAAQQKPDNTITAADTPAVPKEEQPEMQPELSTPEERETTDNIIEAEIEASKGAAEAGLPETAAVSVVPTTTSPTATGSAAEGAEEEHDQDEEVEDSTDYSQMGLEELRQQLSSVLRGNDAMRKFRTISEIQRQYDLKFQAERHEALDRFKEEGGTEDDFAYNAPKEHQDLEKLLSSYRDARHQQRQSQEQQRKSNLERKQEILAQLRQLVESAETKNSNDELKRLQAEWKAIGQVPGGEAQELWDSYHALLDIFYNNRSMFYEMKELDRKRNLEAKLQLVERAEALQEEQSINKALQELRHLHEEWKNIGPVPNDQRDPIWDRFIQASEKVHEKRRAYHEERNQRETQNMVVKRTLLEQLQPLPASQQIALTSGAIRPTKFRN